MFGHPYTLRRRGSAPLCACYGPSSGSRRRGRHGARSLALRLPMRLGLFGPVLCLLFCLTLCGCGLLQSSPDAGGGGLTDHAAKADANAAQTEPKVSQQKASDAAPGLAYTTTFEAPGAPDLLADLKAASLLLRLRDTLPEDATGLTVRANADEAEALRLLRAYGYYAGTVTREVDTRAHPARVLIEVHPGPQFTVGPSAIYYKDGIPAATPAYPEAVATPVGPVGAADQHAEDAAPAAAPRAALPAQDGLDSAGLPPPLPTSLRPAGLREGEPAVAQSILDAVDRLPGLLAEAGYPEAKVLGTRYVVDPESHLLCARVTMEHGPAARMGEVTVRGESRVAAAYLERLRPWEAGQLWDQRRVDAYRDALNRQGLFRSVKLTPVRRDAVPMGPPASSGPTGPSGPPETLSPTAKDAPPEHAAVRPPPADGASLLPASAWQTGPSAVSPTLRTAKPAALPMYDVLLEVADAPQRTLGGGLSYESDRGLGVRGWWEDRNWLNNGELFRTEAFVWEESQGARASFRKPAFLRRDQALTAESWLRNDDTEAFSRRALWAGAGLERRLAPRWTARLGMDLETGDVRDPLRSRRPYSMGGFPLGIRYNGAGETLDPQHGLRADLGVRPLFGYYGETFTAVPTRLDVSGYLPLGKREDGAAWVVLAARGTVASLMLDNAERVPAGARWYGGGGGSVRGYAYQSLGPRDWEKKPLGGASLLETSFEARVRITESVSVVPFLDGGNVYDKAVPWLDREGLRWGAGLGLRWHTAIGPLRVDVATPLQPRKDDAPVFLYLSIGQSF